MEFHEFYNIFYFFIKWLLQEVVRSQTQSLVLLKKIEALVQLKKKMTELELQAPKGNNPK